MPKTKREKGHPRGPISAYNFFLQTANHSLKQKSHENYGFSQLSRQCSAWWKEMTDLQKKPFFERSEADKERFASEMRKFVASKTTPGGVGADRNRSLSEMTLAGSGGEIKGKARRSKKTKDPNVPKRPVSSYLCFCAAMRPEVRRTTLNFDVKEEAKELGRRWSALTPDQKAPYVQMAAANKQRYEQALEVYQTVSQQQDQEQEVEEHEHEQEEDEDEQEDEQFSTSVSSPIPLLSSIPESASSQSSETFFTYE